MTFRFVSAPAFGLVFGLALATASVCAQDAAPGGTQNPVTQNPGAMPSDRYGARGMRGGMGMFGRGVSGTVTEVAPDHYTVKSFRGETYTVHFSANTRMMKEPAGRGRGQGRQGRGMGEGEGNGMGMRGGNPPEPIKASDIKVGDAISAVGELDDKANSMGAVGIFLLNPERAKQMQQMEADYGKTWLMGRVTAIEGVQVTLMGVIDHQPHTVVADENTDFRERRQPITLADIHVGDMVRADGAAKDGNFTATTVDVMRVPPNTNLPRNAAPQ